MSKKKSSQKKAKKTTEALTREALAVTAANLKRIEAEERGEAPPAEAATAPTVNGKAKRGGKPSAKAAKSPQPAKPAKKPKRLSALDAAAQVLAESKQPMRANDLITVMAEKGLWKTPSGKTPGATLYAAMIREIKEKGKEARFVKTDRGLFTARK